MSPPDGYAAWVQDAVNELTCQQLAQELRRCTRRKVEHIRRCRQCELAQAPLGDISNDPILAEGHSGHPGGCAEGLAKQDAEQAAKAEWLLLRPRHVRVSAEVSFILDERIDDG